MGRMTQQTRDSVQLCLHLFLSNIYIAWQSAVEDGNDHITMVQSMFHTDIRNLLKKSVRLICDTISEIDGVAGEQHRVDRGGVHHGAD